MHVRTWYKILYCLLLIMFLVFYLFGLWYLLSHTVKPIVTLVSLLIILAVISLFGLKMPVIQAKAGMFKTITEGPVYDMAVDLLHKAGLELNQIQIFIKPGRAYNAMVNGYRDSYFIVVNQPLIEVLSNEELKAILAHEVAHIKNRDGIKRFFDYALFALLPVLLVIIAALLPNDSLLSRFVGITGIICFVFLFLRWLYKSRKGEYAADLAAAEILGDKETLIQALTILNEKSRLKPAFPVYRKPLLTHPDLNSRIANLRQA